MMGSGAGLTRRQVLILLSAATGARVCPARAAEPNNIAPQPYFAEVNRALEAIASMGAPVAEKDARQIAAFTQINDWASIDIAERILDRYTLARLRLNSDGSGEVRPGGAKKNPRRTGLANVSCPRG